MKDNNLNRMAEAPIPGLIISLAVPTMITMTVTAIYNMADTFFVSQLGTSASGAIGVVFSLMAIIQAVGFTVGMGSGTTVSRLLGGGKKEVADSVVSGGFFFALFMGVVMMVPGLIFLKPLMYLLGSTDTILPYAQDYARYIIYAAPLMITTFFMNNILRFEGKAKLALLGMVSGGLLNMGMDPLFIFVFKMKTAGAGLATALSQCVSFGILLAIFLSGHSELKISPKLIARDVKTYIGILKNGAPSFMRQGLGSIATAMLNSAARPYGDPAIAAMGIVGKIFMLIFSCVIGFGQGFQPVAGYNYGAGNRARLKEACIFFFKVGTAIMTALAAVGFIFAPQIIPAFIKDSDKSIELKTIEIGVRALRWQCAAMPLMPIGTVCNMTFQSIGKAGQATFLAMCRQGVYFLPLIVILPRVLGLSGVEIAQPIADALTAVTCVPFAAVFLKELKTASEKEISAFER